MPNFVQTSDQARLRSSAEIRLRNGTAPRTRGWTVSNDALGVLYRLASNPDTAGEGLKLLHELQAHQVELDLQHEQLEANESDFVEQIAHYKALYEFAPGGYFVLGHDACIVECNLAGAALFGMDQGDICGRSIDSFLRADGGATLGWHLKQLFSSTPDVACYVRSDDGGSDFRHMQVVANLAPGGEAILMIITECEPPPASEWSLQANASKR